MYRGGLKSQRMVEGEAKSRATNGTRPLRRVVGAVEAAVGETWFSMCPPPPGYRPGYFQVLECGHKGRYPTLDRSVIVSQANIGRRVRCGECCRRPPHS